MQHNKRTFVDSRTRNNAVYQAQQAQREQELLQQIAAIESGALQKVADMRADTARTLAAYEEIHTIIRKARRAIIHAAREAENEVRQPDLQPATQRNIQSKSAVLFEVEAKSILTVAIKGIEQVVADMAPLPTPKIEANPIDVVVEDPIPKLPVEQIYRKPGFPIEAKVFAVFAVSGVLLATITNDGGPLAGFFCAAPLVLVVSVIALLLWDALNKPRYQ